ncbi:hypothetical protein [Microbacterium sp. LMI1x-1-1.1]|uniref:hypothetical protein n=1 Tax=Microbacterium sp. LMI1x-1-1.1 TaxID=3135246 RepID=UPI00343A5D4A
MHTDVIFIGGRSGVGKSSVAAEASHLLGLADVQHAVIEGDNLDQAHPPPWRSGIPLAERNLAAMWANYREAGYSRLIFTNTVSGAPCEARDRDGARGARDPKRRGRSALGRGGSGCRTGRDGLASGGRDRA